MASTSPAAADQLAAPAAAAAAAAAAPEEQDTRSRLLKRMPACIIDFFSTKSKLSSAGGVVPLHWEDGQELEEASTKVSERVARRLVAGGSITHAVGAELSTGQPEARPWLALAELC